MRFQSDVLFVHFMQCNEKTPCVLTSLILIAFYYHYYLISYKILPGCDCCEIDGVLVADGYTWQENGKTFGKNAHL